MTDIFKISEEFARIEYAKHDNQHQWSHVQEVMNIALKLAESYPQTDLEILKLAVIFHDVNYESYETHVENSIEVAKNFFNQQKYPEDRTKHVLEAMLSHSGPHRRKLGDTNLIEGKILYDADKFRAATTQEGFEKYGPRFYLDETRNLLLKIVPQ